MAINRIFSFLIIFSFFTNAYAQNNFVKLNFKPLFNNKSIILKEDAFETNDSLKTKIEVLKFYISNICFLKNNKIIAQEKKAYLIDVSNAHSTSIQLKKAIDFDALQFNLGIDSITNVSGALGGDLDPTKGMYWTWQSGYINFKLEGQSDAASNTKKDFQFHLGGYNNSHNCLQTVLLKTNEEHINIGIDISSFFANINLQKTNHIMSPSIEAVALSKILAQLFYIIP